MKILWNEWTEEPEIKLFELVDIKDFFGDYEDKLASKILQTYGVEINGTYFIEKSKLLEILQQRGELWLEEKKETL